MSRRYKGAIISATPPTTSTTSATGEWTLQSQAQAQGAGTWPFGGPFNYIEDVFSTWLYNGAGAAQSITNNIDLSTKGGLVWIKNRANTGGTYTASHNFFDTARGMTSGSSPSILSDTSDAQVAHSNYLIADTTGFSFGSSATGAMTNASSNSYVSWTFRKQPKFFDVVTYTGNGTNNRAISHSLGSEPGCIIVKSTSDAGTDWVVYHRSYAVPTNRVQYLNSTVAVQTGPYWPTAPTSTNFYVAGDGYDNNTTGQTYVAYLFAHNAGGFGLTGTDNVISCGSVVGASQVEVTLGYEPQWILVKNTSAAQDWWLVDNMRGLPVQATDTSYNASNLRPNTSGAETTGFSIAPSATGFKANVLTSGQTYIYIAIRRGPMKVPTDATKVYYPFARAGNDTQTNITGVGFTPDLWMVKSQNIAAGFPWFDRLRGVTKRVDSTSTYLEETFSGSNGLVSLNMDGITIGAGASDGGICNDTGTNYGNWLLKRAPSFFDEVCYTGAGAGTVTHNLGVVPELIIVKCRNDSLSWAVYSATLGGTKYLKLQTTDAAITDGGPWNNTAPTSSVFSVGGDFPTSYSGYTYVAYLFATCAGVSKVGSYTGTGATQTIDCGFTGGARWVMIKRTNSTGDWYVWDTARGMVSGTDPSLLLNSTAAEVNANSVYTATTGFQIVSTAAGINASGSTYIYLAIA